MPRAKIEDWIILERLSEIILKNVDGHIVEIGMGASSFILNKLAVELNRTHYCCDISKRKGKWVEKGEDLKNTMFYRGRSIDWIKNFPDVPLALVFLDGEHVYNTVIQEFNFFLTRLVSGGVIFLHDTYPLKEWVQPKGKYCGDVYKVRQELELRKDIQIFTWPYTAINCGLTMVMKKLEKPFYDIIGDINV